MNSNVIWVEFINMLPIILCGCVLPIIFIWMETRRKMNETNARTQIVTAALEKNPDMDVEELLKKISPKKKLLKEKLLSKLLWGCITSIIGVGLIGFGIFLINKISNNTQKIHMADDVETAIAFGVFLGGTLWQDLPSQHPSEIAHRQGKPYGVPSHQVKLSGDLKSLLGKDILEVNTLHHQAVKDLGKGLVPMAVAPDGIVEAVQMLCKRFVWAVQWHPEYLFRTDKDSLAIFSCFVEHC